MSNTVRENHFDVVIAGGGAAGIGLAASLRSRNKSLKIAIIEPSDHHYYQPSWTLVGGGAFNVKSSKRLTKNIIPNGVTWLQDAIINFNPDVNQLILKQDKAITYEYLTVAMGIKTDWDAIPGLLETIGKNGVTSNYSYDYAPYTWELVKNLKSGVAIFTQPPLPIKCPGAPQKAMYLSCFEWEKQGMLKNIKVELNNAGSMLFAVADFVPALMDYVKRYNAALNFNCNLISINGEKKTATFEVKDGDGKISQIKKSFDMLHVVPPQSPQECLKNSPIANAGGWVDVNQSTLQHMRYPNIFALGDCCSSPNSKTAAAARKQIVVVAENLLAFRIKKPMPLNYDGYGSCPLTVERGKIILAEFGFGGKLIPTFQWLINPLKATKLAWILKKNILPWLYWNAMLKGKEWLARPSGN
ncbi:NAD(P)/FAD-dependent oxidoreductase [Polynucleobacter sp. 31A-FELB]|jgi:sulfide:quinone oxidoreductase|uniref:NAD(P)/FAD-dependent oxidoreductase n=1 Tax=Polynucleobacter sp. 31A-FELB TaxID=2689096 RepID=UPI001C0C293C|nr:FAD/NAD(P)-binding oxidoreductase [Polynucleobacter sp. 31A-FELB]MBU3588389.1 NAD(P)/FAD-dependent oxidoreductase [Polynucleobacter sp. 31A-FELB]